MKSALLVALAVLLLQGGQTGGVRAHHTKAEISTEIRDYNGVTDNGGENVENIKCLNAHCAFLFYEGHVTEPYGRTKTPYLSIINTPSKI